MIESVLGSALLVYASSTHANARIPNADGQRPSPSGYAIGSAPAPRRLTSQPVPRPIASHGLNGRKTSPNARLRTGIPTQNSTYTTVGVRFAVEVCTPASPA